MIYCLLYSFFYTYPDFSNLERRTGSEIQRAELVKFLCDKKNRTTHQYRPWNREPTNRGMGPPPTRSGQHTRRLPIRTHISTTTTNRHWSPLRTLSGRTYTNSCFPYTHHQRVPQPWPTIPHHLTLSPPCFQQQVILLPTSLPATGSSLAPTTSVKITILGSTLHPDPTSGNLYHYYTIRAQISFHQTLNRAWATCGMQPSPLPTCKTFTSPEGLKQIHDKYHQYLSSTTIHISTRRLRSQYHYCSWNYTNSLQPYHPSLSHLPMEHCHPGTPYHCCGSPWQG